MANKKIDYENYMVFPYTFSYIQKKYSPAVLDKYADQLYMLFQNGFDLTGNLCLESVEEQFWLFNDFQTYDDLNDLKKTTIGENYQPVIGLKIVDSVLQFILKSTSWGTQNFVNIKDMGDFYRSDMAEALDNLVILCNAPEGEILSALMTLDMAELYPMIDRCRKEYEAGRNNLLLVYYQKLYLQLLHKHWDITKKFLSTNDKGLISRLGNINDEIYGSSGFYNPENGKITAYIGSAVSNLQRLQQSELDADLIGRMSVIAKECKNNGETDRTVLNFLRGDYSNLEKVRSILSEITFNGILVLCCLKYGLTLDEFDEQNSNRAGRMMREIKSVCDYSGYFFSEVA